MTLDALDEPIIIDTIQCEVCAEWLRFQVVDDHVQVRDRCAYPDGITTEITLDVPSGRIIVADSLHPVFGWHNDEIASYNTTLGQSQAIEIMAGIGCAYGPVGNTCPSLWATGPDTYIIARLSADDDDSSPPPHTCLARICTDLWAYSIADFEHWQSRGGDPATLATTDSVLDIPPGTYRFTHHYGERGFDPDSDTAIFAHIQRIDSDSPARQHR